jgi:Flp pilus assembly protein TadD
LVRLEQDSKAETAFKQALRINPRIPEAYFNLGKIALHGGKDQAAVALFEKAANLDPSDPKIFYQLSLVYRKMGKTRKANFAMNRFRELKPQLAILTSQ